MATYASCPTGIVKASVDTVWGLLTDPEHWGGVLDVRILRVEPPGAIGVGQRIEGESGPRLLHLKVSFTPTLVDHETHRLCMDVHMPFGITVREDLDCAPVGADQCRVNYHCNFEFALGWRGRLTQLLLRRELDAGPADSLARLKAAAERRAAP